MSRAEFPDCRAASRLAMTAATYNVRVKKREKGVSA
jgi:hypothetical protein